MERPTSSSWPPPLLDVGRSDGKIETRPLKEIVRKLPRDHPLRVVILSEPDDMDLNEYFVKLTVWLRLLPIE